VLGWLGIPASCQLFWYLSGLCAWQKWCSVISFIGGFPINYLFCLKWLDQCKMIRSSCANSQTHSFIPFTQQINSRKVHKKATFTLISQNWHIHQRETEYITLQNVTCSCSLPRKLNASNRRLAPPLNRITNKIFLTWHKVHSRTTTFSCSDTEQFLNPTSYPLPVTHSPA